MQRPGHGPGRRGHGQGTNDIKAGEIKVPAADFDFQSSNALFDKAALAPRKTKDDDGSADDATNPSDSEDPVSRDKKAERKEKEREAVAYNPQKSFFDSLSSSTHPGSRGGGDSGGHGGGGRGAGVRRGGGAGKNRREEERERNVATFGEPGGVGLMGPGEFSPFTLCCR
jgi:protein LSM14